MKPLILVLGLAGTLVVSLPLNLEGRQDSPGKRRHPSEIGLNSTLTYKDVVDATAIEYAIDASPIHAHTLSEGRRLRKRQNGIAMGNNKLVAGPAVYGLREESPEVQGNDNN
jgi:hypothetical protein